MSTFTNKLRGLVSGQRALWLAVLLLMAMGAWLRLAHLGERGIPGDELELWRFCHSGASAWAILSGRVEHVMDKLLPAYIKGLQTLFGLPLSPFSLRLPGALLGIFSIPVMYLSGRRLFGPRAGLVPAALLAISPIHVQCSMEAYPYILSTTGMVVALWCFIVAADAASTGTAPTWRVYPALALALVLMMYASIAAWPFAALMGAACFAAMAVQAWKPPRRFLPLAIVALVALVLIGPRVWQYLAASLARGSTAYAQAGYHSGIELFDTFGLRFVGAFGWGQTPLRLGVTLLVVASAAGWAWRTRSLRLAFITAMVVLGFFATMTARYVTKNPFHTRFLAPILPLYLVILSAGILAPLRSVMIRQRLSPRAQCATSGVWLAVLAALLVAPAVVAGRLQGTPHPYREMVAWADRMFPPGTPVLCDRFFDAYNEFMVNPPTNVVFMATTPNEPLERFEQTNWRDGAQAFLERNPDAVFYEAKMFWRQLGPWEWPHDYFAHRRPFIDHAYLHLYERGLVYRDLGPNVDVAALPRTFYYNEPADLAARARTRGETVFVMAGPGWQYVKTRDYRDWRMMGGAATVRFYNLTDAPLQAHLQVEGIAVEHPKRLMTADGKTVTMPANESGGATLGPFTLQPGENRIVLRDPDWGQRQSPLLMQRLEAEAL
jgi:hypothetical protein